MELYRKVRLACRDGMSERAAARHFGVSRQSVRKMLQFSVPPGYRRTAPVRRPKLDEFTALIEQWLEDDRRHGYRKQRHTAKRIFERLRDEHGFTGGYTIVKDYVREHRRHRREMFVPLTHPPGHAQADFGEAWAVIAGVKQKVHFFAFDLPQSDASYVRAYRAATAEAWVDGHVHAFSFFGAVALSIVYDNDRCLVSRIERDGTRRRTRLFSGFLSHYLIGDRYGRPGKGNDKGAVEGLVGWSRRNFMVPLPRFASLEALNLYLEQRCRERQGDVLRGHRESIAKRLERDLEAMTALPGAPFDACHQAAGQVSSQSLVRYHNNDLSRARDKSFNVEHSVMSSGIRKPLMYSRHPGFHSTFFRPLRGRRREPSGGRGRRRTPPCGSSAPASHRGSPASPTGLHADRSRSSECSHGRAKAIPF